MGWETWQLNGKQEMIWLSLAKKHIHAPTFTQDGKYNLLLISTLHKKTSGLKLDSLPNINRPSSEEHGWESSLY